MALSFGIAGLSSVPSSADTLDGHPQQPVDEVDRVRGVVGEDVAVELRLARATSCRSPSMSCVAQAVAPADHEDPAELAALPAATSP